MKRSIHFYLRIILLIILIIILIRSISSEDTWICKDNKWVKHGNPISPKPDYEDKYNIFSLNYFRNLIS